VDGTNSRVRIEGGAAQALEDITDVRITAIVKSDMRVVYDAPREETTGPSQRITTSATTTEKPRRLFLS
jgi:hypothetical protein